MSLNLTDPSPAERAAILEAPALLAPPGVVTDFDHPPNRNDLAHLTNAICLIITAIVALIRVYVKIFCVKKVYLEDYLALLAFGTYIGCISCCYWMMSIVGLFAHQWNLHIRDLINVLYILHVGSNLTAVTILVIKTAILLEWCRLFVPRGSRNAFSWTCRIVLFIHSTFHVVWIFTENFSCIPQAKIWDPTVAGHCMNVRALYIPAAVINLVSDIIIFLLPQKTIWGLQMSTKNKIGVSLVFTLGFLACVAAAFRTYETVIFYHATDVVYAVSAMYLWVLAEMTCLFLVFCVHVAPKAFRDKGLIAKIGMSISRTGFYLKHSDDSEGFRPLRVISKEKKEKKRDPWCMPDEDDEAFGKTASSSSAAAAGPTTQVSADQCQFIIKTGHGILCTTEITAEYTAVDDDDPSRNAGGPHELQYPWSH
ncbi:hypothetical protein F4778DRAFT_743523 [Xylariomycetidae sp. FL2044]|nr:hypothetical protein F4778DRAFT_743523 [Xylariomycetidae sp. FL2044]